MKKAATGSLAVRAAPATSNPQPEENPQNDSASRLTPREHLILFAIGKREVYALAIQQIISDASGGRERITPGTIYPILKILEDKGFVEGEWENDELSNRAGARRRYYRLTDRGMEAVQNVLDFQQRLLNGGEFAAQND